MPLLPLVPLAAALLGAAAPSLPDAPPATAASPRALAAMAGAGPEAPAPETPGSSAAETGLSIAAEEPAATGRSWFAFPMLFYLPETKLGFAATGGVHFHASHGAPSSSAFLVAGYTMENQGSVDLSSDVRLASGTLLSGRFRAVHFPDFFYGIGPEAPESARESFTRQFLDLSVVAELPLHGRKLRAGPRVHAKAEEILDADPGGLVDTGAVTGAEGFSAVGLGFNVTWDSRDQPLWPTRGSYAQASYLWYPSSWGRNDGFGRGALEGRLFLPLGRERVLGLAAIFEENHGATPFTLLSKLGSTRYLRGIPEGRYRDRLGWAAQAEVRVPLTEKIAGALFGAFGAVAPDLEDFDASTLEIAGGAGLRYRLTRQGANLRFDVAASDEGPALYVLLLEAF